MNRIFNNTVPLNCENLPSLTTYSDHLLPIKGKVDIRVRLANNHPGILTTIYVVDDMQNVPALLLGTDFIKAGMGMIAYSGSFDDPFPEVIFHYPTEFRCSVYHESP